METLLTAVLTGTELLPLAPVGRTPARRVDRVRAVVLARRGSGESSRVPRRCTTASAGPCRSRARSSVSDRDLRSIRGRSTQSGRRRFGSRGARSTLCSTASVYPRETCDSDQSLEPRSCCRLMHEWPERQRGRPPVDEVRASGSIGRGLLHRPWRASVVSALAVRALVVLWERGANAEPDAWFSREARTR